MNYPIVTSAQTPKTLSDSYMALQKLLGTPLDQKPFMLSRLSDNKVILICVN
jgi:hypothetical protein